MSEPPGPWGPSHGERHRAVEYQLVDHGLLKEGFTVTPSRNDGRIESSGTCPGCGVRVSYSWGYEIPGYKGIFPRASNPDKDRKRDNLDKSRGTAKSPTEIATAFCECGHMHSERPAEAWGQGCGAFWQVELP